MNRLRTLRPSGSFASAIAGGLVALVGGWAAVGAGLIDVDDGSAPGAAQVALAPVSDGSARGLTVNEIYTRSAPGVAFIEARGGTPESPSPFGDGGGGTASGSGFVFDSEGHVLTNAHVVDGATEIEVTLGEDGEPLPAKLVGADPSTDVAVLDVDVPADELTALPLGDASAVEVGDSAIAIGNPFGLTRTVTGGIVSAVQRQIEAPDGFTISDAIQTDAAINPGNSGGPLLDAAGRVIGINSQIESSSGGNVGIGFAVPIDTARDVAAELLANGSVEHAFLGISGADVTADIADALNLEADAGALVQSVVPNSPADQAGLSAGERRASVNGQPLTAGGDVIVAVEGRPVEGMDDVIAAVDASLPGDSLELRVLRDGSVRNVTIELTDRPASAQG